MGDHPLPLLQHRVLRRCRVEVMQANGNMILSRAFVCCCGVCVCVVCCVLCVVKAVQVLAPATKSCHQHRQIWLTGYVPFYAVYAVHSAGGAAAFGVHRVDVSLTAVWAYGRAVICWICCTGHRCSARASCVGLVRCRAHQMIAVIRVGLPRRRVAIRRAGDADGGSGRGCDEGKLHCGGWYCGGVKELDGVSEASRDSGTGLGASGVNG